MKYNINLESAIMRVNTRIRGEPEILLENCILVSSKDEELKYSKIDRLNTIIYPEGCENLDAPETVFLNMDFRHAQYENAGYIYNLRLSDDKLQILADIKIGEQHQLIDKSKTVYGSSYAHALMAIAEKQASNPIAIKEGKTYRDFISIETYKKYFDNKVIPPLTGLSVELDWTVEPTTDSAGITHIKKYSIVRVSLLANDKTGQQQSRLSIKNFKLKNRSMDELNSITKHIDLFETGNLLKIRDSELANEYLVYQEIKTRACAMCQAEAQKREEELQAQIDGTKIRTEEDVLDAISKLSEMVMTLSTDVQAMKDGTATDSVDPTLPAIRDGESADVPPATPEVTAGEETPAPKVEEEPPVVTPELAKIPNTRMGNEKPNQTKQEIKNRIKL
jgi:hypothetical protein